MSDCRQKCDSVATLYFRAAMGVGAVVLPCAALMVVGILFDGMNLAIAVAAICAVGLAAIGCLLWRIGAEGRTSASPQSGAAMLEFVMVLPIALMLVLLMVQSSGLMVGNLCVNYASYCAARCAAVTVPLNVSNSEGPNIVASGQSAKSERIRLAAVWAMMPVSCSSPEVSPVQGAEIIEAMENLFDAYGAPSPGWVSGGLENRLGYADEYTSIDLSPPADGDIYADDEDLVVTVSHTFYLAVPYAGYLFTKMDSENAVDLNFAPGEYGLVIRSTAVLTNEGPTDYIEPESFIYE